jgi:glycosyltransferase involved in cell wall biosynthesis
VDRIGLSIVVPAYNEATSIDQVLDNLWEVMEDTAFDHRILAVDDGSDDATGSVAKANGFRVLHHPEQRIYDSAASNRDAYYQPIACGWLDGSLIRYQDTRWKFGFWSPPWLLWLLPC